MKINIIGVKQTSFTAKDGNKVEGETVYFTFEDSRTDGIACDHVFLSASKSLGKMPKYPCPAYLEYNRFGKVDSIYITE